MFKKIILGSFVAFSAIGTIAQSGYQFTNTSNVKGFEVEDQCQTGTCWSFATVSFLEAEIMRQGLPPVDLSEMFNVRVTYPLKAQSYVRFQGKQQFGPGGLSHDVISTLRTHGLVPESAYTGLKGSEKIHNHSSLDALLEGTVKTVLSSKLNESGDDAMKINADNYVSLSSFSHHPFYTNFVLEVPDNWAKGAFMNLPLDEFHKVIDYALDNGYTIAWDADVSEKGFSFSNGLAIVPSEPIAKDEFGKKIHPEKTIDQKIRQKAFDEFETTDDHLMHITGKAKDQNGNVYYIIKNSWGTGNPFGGYQYVSSSYLRYKTVSIVLHKDGIPADIKKKIGM